MYTLISWGTVSIFLFAEVQKLHLRSACHILSHEDIIYDAYMSMLSCCEVTMPLLPYPWITCLLHDMTALAFHKGNSCWCSVCIAFFSFFCLLCIGRVAEWMMSYELSKSVLFVCQSVSQFVSQSGEKFQNQHIYWVKQLLCAAMTWQSKRL